MKLWLIRHGMTKGNQEHRYVGATDEGLLPEEKERLQARAADMNLHPSVVFVSPARRCRETAACLFPGLQAAQLWASDENAEEETSSAVPATQPSWSPESAFESAGRSTAEECVAPELIVVPEFMEMNFGAFEYMSWQEIDQDPDPAHRAAYQRYIDSGGETAFPGGESKAAFTKRVCDGFERAVLPRIQTLMKEANASVASETEAGMEREIVFKLQDHRSVEDARPECSGEDIAIVAHGGTIMALMERYAEPHKPYFEWRVKPGEGYRLDLTFFSKAVGQVIMKCKS